MEEKKRICLNVKRDPDKQLKVGSHSSSMIFPCQSTLSSVSYQGHCFRITNLMIASGWYIFRNISILYSVAGQ